MTGMYDSKMFRAKGAFGCYANPYFLRDKNFAETLLDTHAILHQQHVGTCCEALDNG